MYFKKLELVGFKSFYEKTTLNFEPGITAIVGPNGCGKSNIFDSIRWVLGEQSAKSLRGSDMQDVIFNGTDAKEALGMAEVTLVFDNDKGFFPVEQEEVAITRRIFRSGESEYLLNKTVVRLKDILDILTGTGIGAESYSMVAQGKIDLILSSKPEDRRLVFDEASGITKYKFQKREAERKLEETEQNLLRVNDIIVEVKRQIGSLERQAAKARKYKEVFEELKTKEIDLSVLHKKTLLEEKDKIIKQLSELQLQEEKSLKNIKEQEAKITNRQSELKTIEDNIASIKEEMLNLDNQIAKNKEELGLSKEKIIKLEAAKKYLEIQTEQTKNKLIIDQEKLNKSRDEYKNSQKDIENKTGVLKEKESELNNLVLSIKLSLDNITKAKKNILELAIETSKINNDIADFVAKEQILLARKKRLELEKVKLHEEKATTEDNLNNATQELETLKKSFAGLNAKIAEMNREIGKEKLALENINSSIEELGKQRLTLESHKEFIEKLKTKYEDLGESLNAVINLDKLPAEQLTGLVIKIKTIEKEKLKLSGEAKPIDLDTEKIIEKIKEIQGQIESLGKAKVDKENKITQLNSLSFGLQQDLRNQEINLANKKILHQNILEQFNKIKEEEDIVIIELRDAEKELSALKEKLLSLKSCLNELEAEHKKTEALITSEQNNIALNTELKEKALVSITQTKTQLDSLNKRISSDEAALRALEETYSKDSDLLRNSEREIKESEEKIKSLRQEIEDFENKIKHALKLIEERDGYLKENEGKYRSISDGTTDVLKKIELERTELDALKNKLYELQMQNKDVDFKYQSIKDRILQVYKIDLETIENIVQEIEENSAQEEIQRLKEKLDSYGTVNLVAIEEYDELKKRYDFLIQQQNDLATAKESLHQAILKINRTTKQMFLETFEKVKEEFRNYFKLLFNGGDAQIFLIDEQDPLESGIEIICRPPGKKLQNVLLLSGGEKALSAIALIFAIFKVKPSPFCILDEIDAPLDEANVDRFGRLLQEFSQFSQFIVITHNKKTIANTDIMYGITMEESGVSKIVSVKFAQEPPLKDKEPEVAVVEPV
jgi:chromosome segregation protein